MRSIVVKKRVPNEIIEGAKVLIVGRDPGFHEEQYGRPFVEAAPAGSVLAAWLRYAGLRRGVDVSIANVVEVRPPNNDFGRHSAEDVREGVANLRRLIAQQKPNIVIALGNEAAFACMPENTWPVRAKGGRHIWNATGIEKMRGYIFEGVHGVKVLPTLHPAAVRREWVPWNAICEMDMLKAAEEAAFPEIRRPVRNVEIVATKEDAERCRDVLLTCGHVAFDIENAGDALKCVGFAIGPHWACVFPARFSSYAFDVLRAPNVRKIAHNGQYDVYFLRSRCGVHVQSFTEDTIVQWHVLYSELAGAAQDKVKGARGKMSRRTQKRLSMLSSIYCRDEWWKDYDFATEMEQFVLNGKDCCVTFDVWQQQREHIVQAGVFGVYREEMRQVMLCVDALERGMLVDNEKRKEMQAELGRRKEAAIVALVETVLPLVQKAEGTLTEAQVRLFKKMKRCPCCMGGKKRRLDCMVCGGTPCAVCTGEGKIAQWSYNPQSEKQNKIVLYDVLRFRRRMKDGKLRSDESALKDMLGEVA